MGATLSKFINFVRNITGITSGHVLYGSATDTLSSGTADTAGLVDKSSNQATCAGTKAWTASHTWTASSASAIPRVNKAATSQTGNLDEWRDASNNLLAYINAKGSLKLVSQTAEYSIQLFASDGTTSVFRVTNGTGDIETAGTYLAATGFRLIAFGAYCGINSGSRFEFNSADVRAYNPLRLQVYTVAGLPSAGTAGRTAFATNGRKNGEGAGSGTGVLVFDDGTAWRACDTGATVAA